MNSALLASFFTDQIPPDQLPPYVLLGAQRPAVGTVALDSSDQSVVTFDEYTGVAACRSGINFVDPDQQVVRAKIGEIYFVQANPTAPPEVQLPTRLALDQYMRFLAGRRPFYATLRPPSLLPPRAIAAQLRVVEDYHALEDFLDSGYVAPGMLYLADGRLKAQNFPGADFFDQQARKLRDRGVRAVGIAKSGLLVSAVAREVRAVRRHLRTRGDGKRPFIIPITRRHLMLAYRGGQQSSSPKTIRHGSSSSALGGAGAVRFALCISGTDAMVIEFSLYDLIEFAGLARSGETLEHYMDRRRADSRARTADAGPLGPIRSPVYSWHILPLAQMLDWDTLFVPTLEEVVWNAYTDTELGIYPRPLADIHNRVKLRQDDPEIEAERRRIIVDLVRQGVSPERILVEAVGPHKTDPDEYDMYTG